ncbi:MAG TPA: hypothetical protein VGJ93_15565 [Desulfuromonadaceae bacterium]|jgi:hypothetical protein
MSKIWEKVALEVGKIIQEASVLHPELGPLNRSFMNFARKYHVQQPKGDSPVIAQLVSAIHRQAEEVTGLECRIKTLLRHK